MPKTKVRRTFGLFKQDGSKYHDVIKAFILPYLLTCEDFDIGYITIQNIEYKLDTDRKVRTELGLYGSCSCNISFQVRTNTKIAIARIKKEGI